jgi:hypothetical protein
VDIDAGELERVHASRGGIRQVGDVDCIGRGDVIVAPDDSFRRSLSHAGEIR